MVRGGECLHVNLVAGRSRYKKLSARRKLLLFGAQPGFFHAAFEHGAVTLLQGWSAGSAYHRDPFYSCLPRAPKCCSMLRNSRTSEACWGSKSSSGMPGPWNIVNV